MCRLAAYLGPEIRLDQFLLEHEHSLVKQAWAPREMQTGTVNADGFGFAWLAEDKTFCAYKHILPIWSDTNLQELGQSLTSPLWLANVRGATPGQSISEANTQPFLSPNLAFTHNGCLTPFDKTIKTRILESIKNEIRAEMNGDSDSSYLFALLRHHLDRGLAIPDAVVALMQDLGQICHQTSAMLNFIISDGESLYACRHAINADCPSLYYRQNDTCIWLASEALFPDEDWRTVPEKTLLQFHRSGKHLTIEL